MRFAATKRVFIFYWLVTSLTLGGEVRGQTYYVQPGDSLYSIAVRYGASVAALQRNNKLTTTEIYPGQILSLNRSNPPQTVSPTYTARSGDSLLIIAKRYRVSLNDLKTANNLALNYVTEGRVLKVPGPYRDHRVQSGESLFLIAQRYGVTIDDIRKANGFDGDIIRVGQSLKIPMSRGESSNSRIYIVQSGDPISLIAKRNGLSVKALLEANHLSSASQILPGKRLIIPARSKGPSSRFILSRNDIDLLARLVSAESAGEPFLGQVAVAATVLNRLEDPRYPNTVPGVIYQVDNGKYQYSPVLDGRINLPACLSAYQAVEQALYGSDPSNGGNGFYNPAKTNNQWVRSQPVTAVIGEHVFFRY
jgi:N-acetylmuramoyl-L-alanine amidase